MTLLTLKLQYFKCLKQKVVLKCQNVSNSHGKTTAWNKFFTSLTSNLAWMLIIGKLKMADAFIFPDLRPPLLVAIQS